MSYYNTLNSTQFKGAIRVSDSTVGNDGNCIVDRNLTVTQNATVGGILTTNNFAPIAPITVNTTTTLPSSTSSLLTVICQGGVGNYTITLPAPTQGYTVFILNRTATGVVTLASPVTLYYENPVGTFNSGSSISLYTDSYVEAFSDGSSWYIVYNSGLYSIFGGGEQAILHLNYNAVTNTVTCDCNFTVDLITTLLGNTVVNGGLSLNSNILTNSQTVTPTQLGYVSGVTSNIQTQLNSKIGANLLTVTGNTTLSNSLPDGTLVYLTSTGGYTVTLNYGQPNGTIMLIANFSTSGVILARGSTDTVNYLATDGTIVNATSYTLTRYSTLLAYYSNAAWYLVTDVLAICGLLGAANSWTGNNTFTGFLNTGKNASGTFPTTNTTFGTIMGNYTGGAGELDFVSNYTSSGSTAAAFSFYRNGNTNPLLQINADGTSTFSGAIIAQNNVTLGTSTSQTTTLNSNISANSQIVTPTQLGYLSGATSNIQTQLNSKFGPNEILISANTTLSNSQPNGSYIKILTGGVTVTFNTGLTGGWFMMIANDTGSNVSLTRGGTDVIYCYNAATKALINLTTYTFSAYATAFFFYNATSGTPGWVLYHDIAGLCGWIAATNTWTGINVFNANVQLGSSPTGTTTTVNSVLNTQGTIYVGGNTAGAFPAAVGFGTITGNYATGQGEMDFIANYTASGGSAQSFNFYRYGVTTALLSILANGNATLSGLFTASNGLTVSAGSVTVPNNSIANAALATGKLTDNNTWSGSNTYSGLLNSSNSSPATFPTVNTTFGTIMGNYSAGAGEMDFVSNYTTSGGSATAFNFYRNGNTNPLLSINANGNVAVSGALSAGGVAIPTAAANTTWTGMQTFNNAIINNGTIFSIALNACYCTLLWNAGSSTYTVNPSWASNGVNSINRAGTGNITIYFNIPSANCIGQPSVVPSTTTDVFASCIVNSWLNGPTLCISMNVYLHNSAGTLVDLSFTALCL